MNALVANDAAAVQAAVREGTPLIPVAGGTQTAAHPDPAGPARALDVSGLRGVVEYDPAELTFTARPGTPLAEIESMLATNGQHLPFDPPRLGEGGTIGGAVAAGVTGPGGFAAGIRDFVIGVRLVDGTGRLAMGGGKVVKNAAGFDLPKMIVGSLGRLGVIVELSLKVFPRPAATATVRFPTDGLEAGLAAIAGLARGTVAVTALDLAADGAVTARIGGAAELIEARAARLARSLDSTGEVLGSIAEPTGHAVEPTSSTVGTPSPSSTVSARLPTAGTDLAYWDEARRFAWVGADERLVVVPVAPRQIVALDADLGRRGLTRRYGLAANVAWVAWPEASPAADLSELLAAHGIGGVALTGPPLPQPLLGAATGGDFGRRVARALDPAGVFAGVAR